MKRLLGITLLGAAMLAQSGYAAISGGNAVISRAFSDSTSNFALVDLNNPINGAGQISQWQIFALNTNQVKLLLYHPTGGGNYTLLGQSTLQTPVAGVNTFTLSSPVNVQSGDFAGLFFPGAGSVAFDLTGPLLLGDLSGSVLVTAGGTGIGTFTNSSQRTYSLAVTGAAVSVTPVPPSLMLTLVGIAMIGFYAGSRKFARA